MRIIEKCWVDLHHGYQTVARLEARLRSDWSRALQVARKREERAALIRRRQTRKIAGIAFLVCLFLCVLLWIGIFTMPDSRGQLLYYSCLLTLPGIISGAFFVFQRGNPSIKAQPHPFLDLTEAWWESLKPKRYVIRTTGGRAEVEFLKSLSFLDHNHIAVWGLLTSAKITSDTDVLLLGPTGIWLFEVKYWNGVISKRNNIWYTDHPTRGRKIHDKSPDEQWQDQRNEISETIRRRLPSRSGLVKHIKGGVVFAHESAKFGQIDDHRAAYGRPESWRKRIRQTGPVQDFSMRDRLQVLDALVQYANLHEKEKLEIVSARAEADQLYDNAVTALRKYVSERVK